MSTSRTDAISFDPRRIESLLAQGANGHHVLFDSVQIRRGLSRGLLGEDHEAVVDELHQVMAELIHCDDIGQQRSLIANLPDRLQDVVVRMYFHFLDQYLKNRPLTWH